MCVPGNEINIVSKFDRFKLVGHACEWSAKVDDHGRTNGLHECYIIVEINKV